MMHKTGRLNYRRLRAKSTRQINLRLHRLQIILRLSHRRHLQLLRLQKQERNLCFAQYVALLYAQMLFIVEVVAQNCVDWRITVCYND